MRVSQKSRISRTRDRAPIARQIVSVETFAPAGPLFSTNSIQRLLVPRKQQIIINRSIAKAAGEYRQGNK